MKKTATLFLLFCATIGLAQNPSDMIRNEIEKSRSETIRPAMNVYIEKSLSLVTHIREAGSKKEIRRYANELSELSDDFNAAVAELYNYKNHSAMEIAIIPSGNNNVTAVPVTHHYKTGVRPPMRDTLNEISECSAWLSWFTRNKSRKADQLETRIRSLQS